MSFSNLLTESINDTNSILYKISKLIASDTHNINNEIEHAFDSAPVNGLYLVELESLSISSAVMHVATIFKVNDKNKKDWYFPFCIKITFNLSDGNILTMTQSDEHFEENIVNEHEYTDADSLLKFMNDTIKMYKL